MKDDKKGAAVTALGRFSVLSDLVDDAPCQQPGGPRRGRGIGYLRTSTVDPTCRHLDRQMLNVHAAAMRVGIDIVRCFYDAGDDRAGLAEVLRCADCWGVSFVFVESFDRLARRPHEFVALWRLMRDRNLSLMDRRGRDFNELVRRRTH